MECMCVYHSEVTRNELRTCLCVQPWAAIIIGISGGLMYVLASWLISNVMMIDDPLDAGAVHGFCGAWGLIVVAFFAHKPFVAQVYGDETAAAGHGARAQSQAPSQAPAPCLPACLLACFFAGLRLCLRAHLLPGVT